MDEASRGLLESLRRLALIADRKFLAAAALRVLAGSQADATVDDTAAFGTDDLHLLKPEEPK